MHPLLIPEKVAKVADMEGVSASATIGPVTMPPPGGLPPEHLRQLAEARHRAAKVRRAAFVATLDGWSIGLFGALTFLCGLFSWIGLVLGGIMLGVALVELRGARRLRRLDPDAARTLGFNQIVLGSALLAYAIYSLWGVFRDRSALLDQLAVNAPELAGMGSLQTLARAIGILIYGTLAAVAIFGQGATAWYYFSRRRHINAYLRDTPHWIIDAHRAGMPL
jgi:hypothetical protein